MSAADSARVEEVSRLARAGAVETLVEMLGEPSWVVRRAVVDALAQDPASVDHLCRVLLAPRTDEARLAAAVEALSASCGAADDALLHLLGDEQPPAVICDAAQVLGRRRCARAVAQLARLTAGADDNVAAIAVEALGRIGGGEAVEALLAAVASRRFFRTFPALAPLGRSADPRAIPPLVALLEEPRYASEAAAALGHSAHLAATHPLVELLVNEDDALVRAAAGALERLRGLHEARFDGTFAVASSAAGFAAAARARLRACFEGGRAADRVSVSVLLGWLHDDTAIAELLELGRAEPGDGDIATRARAALVVLGAHATPRLLEALRDGTSAERLRLLPLLAPTHAALAIFMTCLGDGEPRVRAHACRALAKIGDVTAVPALFRLVGDLNASVAQAAVAAIGVLGSAEATGMTLDLARSNDPARRRAGLRLVARFGLREGLDTVLVALTDPIDRIRDAAIGALPFLDDARARTALLDASSDPTPGARAAAMRALGHSKDADAADALGRGLRDNDAWVRYYACQALGNLAVFAALSEVIPLVDDPAGQVRVAAIEAIGKLGDGQATLVLDQACRSTDPDIRRAAILGLGGCKRAEALPSLLREAASDDSTTRLYALSALAESDSDEATTALVHLASDAVRLVERAAMAVLAARPGARSTQWLVEQLGEASRRILAAEALEMPLAGRIEGILTALEGADSSVTPLLIGALSAMDSAEGQAAIAATLALDNVHARRSAARALTAADTSEARVLVDRTKLTDPDDEVRRICAAVLR